MRDLLTYSGLQRKLHGIGHDHEILWERAITPEEEQRNLDDFIVLSPVSSGRSPLSASRADHGLIYKIELPFRYLWEIVSTTFITAFLILSELFTIHNPFKGKKKRGRYSSTPRANETSLVRQFLTTCQFPSNE